MGSTSSSHNSADSIDVLWGQKETIVVLQLIFVPLCMVFLTLKYLAHNRGNYRLLFVFLYFFLERITWKLI